MNNYKTVTYVYNNNLTDFSIRHLRRRIKELYEEGNKSVIYRGHYLIDISNIKKLLGRIRSPKKTSKKNNIINPVKTKFNINISINIKSDDVAFSSNYNEEYYHYIALRIFDTLNSNCYYIIEKDRSNFHLHMGCSTKQHKNVVKNQILKLMKDEFDIQNKHYYSNNGEKRECIYVEDMIDDYANRNYIGKGSDHLGGIPPIFLNVDSSLNGGL